MYLYLLRSAKTISDTSFEFKSPSIFLWEGVVIGDGRGDTNGDDFRDDEAFISSNGFSNAFLSSRNLGL